MSQATDERVITVQDAIQIAMQQNPELKYAEEQVQVQRSLIGPSWGIESPEVYYFREGMDDGVFSEQRWGVSQSVAFPLTGYLQQRKASVDLDVAQLEADFLRIRIRADVKRAYTNVVYTIKKVDLARNELQLAEELREIASARLDVGESTELDLIQSDIQLNEARNRLLQAREMHNSARYELFRVMGTEPGGQEYGISYADTLVWVDIALSQEEVLKELSESPEMLIARKISESAKQKITTEKSRYLPGLRFDYYYQDFGSGYDFTGFEVGVSIPLWFGVNESRRVMQARSEFRQTEWNINKTHLRLNERAENAWHSYITSREAILSYKNFVQSRASTLLELTREGYRAGELDLLRVLEAQRTYLESEQQYYESLKNYYEQLIELEKYIPKELVFTGGGSE
ncbi:TolC family protein [Rhodohalobacter mucosus]|nr:TolC family protein [Rhodohalobacter mucosus]